MVSIKSCSSNFLLFLSALTFLFLETRSTPVPQEETAQNNKTEQGRQGILEIPKQAATIIRNFIDKNLHTYLNIPTPAPQNNIPPELKDSIVGNFLLGNFYATLPPASTFTPEVVVQQSNPRPIFISNEPSYVGHSQQIESTTLPPPPLAPVVIHANTTSTTNKPQESPVLTVTGTSPTSEKVHVLDTDASLSGIYNGLGVQVSSNPNIPPVPPSPVEIHSQESTDVPPKIKPNSVPEKVYASNTDAYVPGIHNSYGVLLGNPDDEVFWVPDITRPSVIIPIETSTTQRTTSTAEPPTEETPVEGTTEDEEEEGSVE